MQSYHKWLPLGMIGLTALLLTNGLVGEKNPLPSVAVTHIGMKQFKPVTLSMLTSGGSTDSTRLNVSKDSSEKSNVRKEPARKSDSPMKENPVTVAVNRTVAPSTQDIQRVAYIRESEWAKQSRPVVLKSQASRGGTTQTGRLIDAALSLRGIPYKWGGTTRSGFDCSGFVGYVFRSQGITLPRTSFTMYGVGVPVSRNELRPGDLVFFATYSKGPTDVRIYIGNGLTVGSASDGVAIHSLSESYWNKHYLGARRILN